MGVAFQRVMPLRHLSAPGGPVDAWPAGGGVCGQLIRTRDWSGSALGPIVDWPPALRITVSNMLGSPVPQALIWGERHVMLYNDGYIEIAGDRHPAALGEAPAGDRPATWDWNSDILARGFAGEVIGCRDQPLLLHRRGRAETLYLDLFYTPVRHEDGRVGGVLCTAIDNTARVAARAEAASRAAEVRMLTDALPLLIAYYDAELICRFVNAGYAAFTGVAQDDLVGRRWHQVVGDAAAAARRPLILRALAGERTMADAVMLDGAGSARHMEVRYVPRHDPEGQVTGVYSLAFDVEERVQREAALHASNERFRAAVDAVQGVVWTNDAQGMMIGEQPGWATLTGQAYDQYQNYGWTQAIHPADVAATLEAWHHSVSAMVPFVCEHRVRRADGAWRVCAIRAVPTRDGDGMVQGWVGVHTDITDQRAADEALREQATALTRQMAYRRHAEDQLRQLNETLEARIAAEIAERRQAEAALVQAQKMETIGQLTGGVAHDFNNLLQIVSGNLQLLEHDVAGDARARRRVANAMAGVERGARLASQLLAFGRRQALEPRTVNVAQLVHGMDEMLRRAVGEPVTIDLSIEDGLWDSFIDPARIENALLNLAINARDAMGGQGALTIAIGNRTLPAAGERAAGDYVRLAVGDTGSGMTPEIAARVFEPFFSTKGEGKGTGLGLSMVYGFVRQSGGHVDLRTAPGAGTTVELYLPRASGAVDEEPQIAAIAAVGGSETVLVVEDDEEVRATVVELFRDLGYRVRTACHAGEALELFARHDDIDLLFTDVVMPGPIDSATMAHEARLRHPHLAVLFTSGYAKNGIVHGGRLDPGLALLPKPYSREALARRVRQVLADRRDDVREKVA